MQSVNPSGAVVRSLFRLVLASLGLGMSVACRLSARFRSQVTRELVVQVGSADGVVHHYRFAPRTVTSISGPSSNPTLNLCFDNASLGTITLLSPRAVGRIVNTLLARTATYQGNAVLLLWFYGLTRFVLPIGRSKRVRPPPPDAYVQPDLKSKVADSIVREPPSDALDPTWTAAHEQHAKMIMIRGSGGEAVPMW
jgi:hypothetical protein